MLLSTVEQTVLLFQMIADNGGYHIKQVFKTSVDHLYVFNKLMLSHLGVIFVTHLFYFPSIKFH